MPTVQALIPTDRAHRYLTQFCDHAIAMAGRADAIGRGGRGGRSGRGGHGGHSGPAVSVEASEARGVVVFGDQGRCTIEATPTALLVRIEAASQEALSRIRQTVTADLGRFGRRDALTVSWTPTGPAGAADPVDPAVRSDPSTPMARREPGEPGEPRDPREPADPGGAG